MNPPLRHSPEAVLEQLDWVARLARQLCSDVALAEDASQEVLLAAWRKPPPDGASLRSWLAGVLRKRLRQEQRSEGRRRAHEALAAREDESSLAPASEDLVDRARLSRQVVDAVIDLREPYRSTLLQRYVEDLTPKQIAERSNEALPTVKARLRRGLAELRQVLDRQHGNDGRSWALALLPLLPKAVPAAATTGVLAVSSKPLILPALAVALLALGGYMTAHALRPASAIAEVEAAPSAALAAAEPGGETVAAASLDSQRVEQQGSPQPAASAVAADESTQQPRRILVRARVIDLDSKPLAGVQVHFRAQGESADSSAEPIGTTGAGGELDWQTTPSSGFLFARGPGLVTCIEGGLLAIGSSPEVVIIAAPARTLSGTVQSESGAALTDAKIEYTTDADLRTHFEVAIGRATRVRHDTQPDALGRFEFDAVPELPEAALRVECVGYQTEYRSVARHGALDETFVLQPLAPRADTVFGRVLDRGGAPVAGALVSLGTLSQRSREDGKFQLDVPEEENEMWVGAAGERRVRALHTELGAGVFELEPGDPWPDTLEIYLDQQPLEISGVVVDAGGSPVAGAHIKLHQPTPFGFVEAGSEVGSYMGTSVERSLAGRNDGEDPVSDADGRFSIGGLLERDYRLFVYERESLRAALSPPFAGGQQDVEIVLPDSGERTTIAGRVVDEAGLPLAGISVSVQRSLSAAQVGSDEA